MTSTLMTSHTQSECTDAKPEKPVLDQLDHTSLRHESLISASHGPPVAGSAVGVTEREHGENFLGGPPSDEEGTAAGCGKLEGSSKFEQDGTPDGDRLKGEDKVHHELPSLTSVRGQRLSDLFLSPTKCEQYIYTEKNFCCKNSIP